MLKKTNQPGQIYLSVVATSRNDNHGDDLLFRMQHFINGFVQQCIRYQLNAELILVEWNPPPDKPPLAQALVFPSEKGPCQIRIITVPPEIHQQLKHANKLPLFQMIAKNVGIRRARGQYVLATNIDILFPDKLILYLKTRVKANRAYHTTRIDVPSNLPHTQNIKEILSFCKEKGVRAHKKHGTYIKQVTGKWELPTQCPSQRLHNWLSIFRDWFMLSEWITIEKKDIKSILQNLQYRTVEFIHQATKHFPIFTNFHTNASGDFTLLSYEDWLKLRGYPEWEMYSWHIDGILLYQAHHNGIKKIFLRTSMPVYHIDHSVGSGFTPEKPDALFERLDKNNVPYITSEMLSNIIADMKREQKLKRLIQYNKTNWGFADQSFKEILI